MTLETKTKLAKAGAATKKTVWKYFGAAFMEQKDGQQAVSLTRGLAIICFGLCVWKWSVDLDPTQTLLYSFWGLIGGKTAETMISKLRGKSKPGAQNP